MKRKRILAWLVVLCLLVGMIPQLAMAVGENHIAGDGDVPLKLEFLGVDTDHSGPKSVQSIPTEGLKTNDVIWLGISVEGLTKDKMSVLDGYGIFAMTMGVNYDTTYLEPYTDWNYSTNAAITQDRYRAAAFRGSVGQYTVGTGSASAELWGAKDAGGGTLYTIDDSTGYGMALDANTETSALDASSAKLLKIVVKGGSGVYNEDMKLYNSTETGKVWLARFPMKVVDDTANGKAVIELALGGQVFSYTIVESESNVTVTDRCGAWTVEESSNNLRKVFDYQDMAQPLFPETFTITYHDNATEGIVEGTSVDGQTQRVKDGSNVATDCAVDESIPGELLAGPSRTGYIFKGWFTEAECTTEFTATTTVTADVDLYAKWEEGYKLTFNPNEGTLEGVTPEADGTFSKEYAKSDNAVDTDLPTGATKDNYTFAGWNTAQNGSGTDYTDTAAAVAAINGAAEKVSTTFYAQWTPADDQEKVTVTFNGNGGGVANPAEINIVKNDTIGTAGMPNEPARTNYTFKEWNTKANGTGTVFTGETQVTESIEVYAIWENPTNPVIVTFDKNGGTTEANPNTITIQTGEAIGTERMPDAPTKDGYTFTGWNTAAKGTGNTFDGTTTVSADITVYAQYEEQVEVTFDKGTGTFVAEPEANPIKADKGGKLTQEQLDKFEVTPPTDYKFVEWNSGVGGSGEKVDTNYTIPGTMTAYAVYTVADEVADKITVNFDANATGITASPESVQLKSGDKFGVGAVIPGGPARENYVFDGWYTDTVGGDKLTNDTDVTALAGEGKELTVYAHWTIDDEKVDEANQLKVTFYKNIDKTYTDTTTPRPASDILGTVEVVKGEKLGLTQLPTAVRGGFTFEAWGTGNKDTNGAPESWDDAKFAATAIDNNTNFYALWSSYVVVELDPDTLDVTYDGTPKAAAIKTAKGAADEASFVWETAEEIDASTLDYEFIYDAGAAGTTTPYTDVGVYNVAIDVKEVTVPEGEVYAPDTLEFGDIEGAFELKISPVGVTIKLVEEEGNTQDAKTDGATATELKFEVVANDAVDTTLKATLDGKFVVTYKEWIEETSGDPPVGDGKISANELIALAPADAKPTTHGKYVAQVSFEDTNYVVTGLEGIEAYSGDELTDDEATKKLKSADLIKLTLSPNVQIDTAKITNKGAEGADVDAKLYTDNTLAEDKAATFAADNVGPYYTQVPADNELKIVLTGTLPADQVSVSINDTPNTDVITVNDDGTEATIIIPSSALTAVDGTGDGFKNTVVVKVGDKEYTFNVRQLVKAVVELAPGNSPYGRIERMGEKWYSGEGTAWTAEEITAAKTAFDTDFAFGTTNLPDGIGAGTKYNVRAWGDVSTMTEVAPGTDLEKWKQENPEGTAFINHDKDSNAIFVFIKQANVLPEIMLYDSEGKEVQPTEALPVTVSVTLDYMSGDAVDGFKGSSTSEEVTFNLTGADGENVLDFTDRSKLVKPGIYTMTYSYTDKNGQKAEVKRTIVVIAQLGDVDMNTYFDTTDAQLILRHSAVNVPNEDLEGNEFGGRLYAYRICDVDGNSYFDTTDAQMIKRYSAAPIVQLYTAIGVVEP